MSLEFDCWDPNENIVMNSVKRRLSPTSGLSIICNFHYIGLRPMLLLMSFQDDLLVERCIWPGIHVYKKNRTILLDLPCCVCLIV